MFDQLVWPSSSRLFFGGGPDEEFLQKVGVLTRRNYTLDADLVENYLKSQVQAFIDLDRREPGQWSLAQGVNSFFLREKLIMPDSGAQLELQRAIPIPDKDVPLNEVLEFKRRRGDELQRLRAELDGFMEAINQAEDNQAELQTHIATIDAACADVLRVSHEWQFPVRLTNIKASVELRPFVTAVGGVSAYALGTASGLSASAAILAGIGGAVAATAPALKLAGDFGWRGLKRRLGPTATYSNFTTNCSR